ncbi:uncharacterized protein LOC126281380 isoform X1 [Schistocerca gregaria]|uniref:uncharacterized protein LOC126281380 isoform X1 n=1 Tax=Schistocerca gregaria TaxID=7010 RepID=UPI00211EC20B|nr:uncharacterized protein LOC126281380 isoform X1 [Schistocerca gregaria]
MRAACRCCLIAMAAHVVLSLTPEPGTASSSSAATTATPAGSLSESPAAAGAPQPPEAAQLQSSASPQPPPPPPHVVPAAPTPGAAGSGRRPGHHTVAPLLLAHIFDTHSPANKHHHHDHRWGPHFEDDGLNVTNVTVQVGDTAVLNCKISLLQDKVVSWVFRQEGSEDMQLLTVGHATYSADQRYVVDFQYPNNWRLLVQRAAIRDQGLYECQVSTHPPRAAQSYLLVQTPEVMIVDEQGHQVHDKFYEAESTIQLSCLVRHVSMTSSVVTWLHGDRVLNYDTTRGGISVRTDLTNEGANSSLSVARVDKADSGNYTCSISTTEFATVAVHILNGESLAELHLSHCVPTTPATCGPLLLVVALATLLAALRAAR